MQSTIIMAANYNIPTLPLPYDLETKAVLKQLNKANMKLAELKGVAHTIPNEHILISTLTLQEAKVSSAVENIITTQDDLYQADLDLFDGNGRTGRIINILYLVATGLLDLPILYLSRYITHNKAEYYRLIQAIRDKNEDNAAEWEAYVLFMLKGVEQTAEETIRLVVSIGQLMNHFKQILRPLFAKQYKHELLNNLFYHPYTKIEYIERDMQVSRQTASKYLNMIVDAGLLDKQKFGKENYYINTTLMELFLNVSE